MRPTFLDTNVPIYAAGRPHPLQAPCRDVLDLVATAPAAFFTDAEVFQELLYRYTAQRDWQQGRPIFDGFLLLMVGRIEPVFIDDVSSAATLTSLNPRLSARDLIHLALMQRVGATRIITADRDFDSVAGIQRLDPVDLPIWRRQLGI